MVKKVWIVNYTGEQVEYNIEGVDVENNNGLFITEIEGLGPTGADIIFTKMVNVDGSLYNSKRINERNIIIHGRFLDAETVEEARYKSYRLFPLGKPLQIWVWTDNRVGFTTGYVEKNEPNIFSSAEDVQISIVCESPTFVDGNGLTIDNFSNTEALFEFVYENEGFELNTEFGNYIENRLCTIDYKGEGEVGYRMIIYNEGLYDVDNPTIFFHRTGESLTFKTNQILEEFGHLILPGDSIELVSLDNEKTCYYRSGDSVLNIINDVEGIMTFSWPKLVPGDSNKFTITANPNSDGLKVYISYLTEYQGV